MGSRGRSSGARRHSAAAAPSRRGAHRTGTCTPFRGCRPRFLVPPRACFRTEQPARQRTLIQPTWIFHWRSWVWPERLPLLIEQAKLTRPTETFSPYGPIQTQTLYFLERRMRKWRPSILQENSCAIVEDVSRIQFYEWNCMGAYDKGLAVFPFELSCTLRVRSEVLGRQFPAPASDLTHSSWHGRIVEIRPIVLLGLVDRFSDPFCYRTRGWFQADSTKTFSGLSAGISVYLLLFCRHTESGLESHGSRLSAHYVP